MEPEPEGRSGARKKCTSIASIHSRHDTRPQKWILNTDFSRYSSSAGRLERALQPRRGGSDVDERSKRVAGPSSSSMWTMFTASARVRSASDTAVSYAR